MALERLSIPRLWSREMRPAAWIGDMMIKVWPVIFAIALQPMDVAAQSTTQNALETLVRSYLWPRSEAEFRVAQAALADDSSLVGVSRMVMHDLEEILRRGSGEYETAPPPVAGQGRGRGRGRGRIPLQEFSVAEPDGAEIPVLVRLPSGYTPDVRWPLMFAMHGGPPGSAEGARRSTERMIEVWADAADRAGWIVAAPVMVSTVARDGRTRERLPYEIFHPEEASAVIAAVRKRYNVHPDRIVSTGISLGSNFSLGYAGAGENWVSAIVPVSTEGESREHLLRNLSTVPTYVLEGSLDQNIRGVSGPRALENILTAFGYDLTYREFGDRAHEGFQEHYDDVLRWLATRPRQTYPREVLRVPHRGIMPVNRRIHWVEAATRQAAVRATVTSSNRIDVTARWTGEVKLFLHDRLLDLDHPIEIWANGVRVFSGSVRRSIVVALEQAKRLGDEGRVYAAVLSVKMPTSASAIAVGERFWASLAPRHSQGTLSFWEMYAVRALEERFPSIGFEGDEAALPDRVPAAPEQVGLRVTAVDAASAVAEAGLRAGDLLIDVGGEPFFRGAGGVAQLYHWIVRELRGQPASYPLTVWRDGNRITLEAVFQLGSYIRDSGDRD